MIAFDLAMCEAPEQEEILIAMYYENRKTMLMKAIGILHNNGWAEDAVHEAFLRISNNIEVFMPLSCNERRYLCVTIVRNISLNILRDSHQSSMEPYDDDFLPVDEKELTDEMISVEQMEMLEQCINDLPTTLGEVVLYRLVLELNTAQTAGLLKISEEAVRARLHRGRKLLIKMLAKEGITYG